MTSLYDNDTFPLNYVCRNLGSIFMKLFSDAISDRRHDDNSKLSIDEQQRCISVDSGYVGGGASSQHISPANSQVFSELYVVFLHSLDYTSISTVPLMGR